VLQLLIQRERTSNEGDDLRTSRERGIASVVVNWVAERGITREKSGRKGRYSRRVIRLAVTREVHPTKVANTAICVDEMPTVCEYSTSSITGPIVCIGWNRSHSIGQISRRMDGVLAKMYACCQVERGKRLGTSSVPTEDTLRSMGKVGVEILDRNVVSEVTVS
jgi:hypothetical protein